MPLRGVVAINTGESKVPTRAIVQAFCDVCFAEQNENETPATDKLRFAWQGRGFLLLVCDKHVDPIRTELQRLSELATLESVTRRPAASPASPDLPRVLRSRARPSSPS